MTTKRPLLSLCIPTYSRADWLRVCLMALTPMVQKAGDQVEVIVSDNCSSDNGQTARVVKEIQSQYPLRYFRHETNIGGSSNMQYAVNHLAHGEYLWLIGDDDVPCNDSITRILTALEQNPQIDFVYVNHLLYDGPQPLSGSVEPGSVSVYNSDFDDRYLPHLSEIVAVEANCFTAIYGFVLRRTLAAEAFQFDTATPAFAAPETVVPHAAFIIKRLLHKPAWYLGQPGLIASTAISWRQYQAQYGLVLMHDLYDLLEANGVEPSLVDTLRRRRLRFTANLLWAMLSDPKTGHHDRFSLWEYQKRHARFPELWTTMAEITQHANAVAATGLQKAA